MIGMRFGRLTVIGEGPKKNRQRSWICQCDCGNTTAPIKQGNLPRTKSCGCWKKERLQESPIARKHKRSNTRLYYIWQAMKQRCFTSTHRSYELYGGRGITVCDDWRNSFSSFEEWALKNGYNERADFGQCTLDRIDVNGDYTPNNCRWTTMKVQQNNRRNNRKEAMST